VLTGLLRRLEFDATGALTPKAKAVLLNQLSRDAQSRPRRSSSYPPWPDFLTSPELMKVKVRRPLYRHVHVSGCSDFIYLFIYLFIFFPGV
jgi:hypothetical protein